MSFRYINPGYAELFDTKTGTTVEGELYNPINNVSFWQQDKEAKMLKLSECPKDFYGRFDLYLHCSEPYNEECFTVFIGIYNTGIEIQRYRTTWYVTVKNNSREIKSVYGYKSSSEDTVTLETGLMLEKVNSIYFHAKSCTNFSTRDGRITIMINGKQIIDYTDMFSFYDTNYVNIYSTSPNALISNLILSDEEISPKEQVIGVPVLTADTDMIDCGDGSYKATAAGQKLLLTHDITKLVEDYGADSKITGILQLGNPAYRTGSGISSLTEISRKDGLITEYETKQLETDTSASVLLCRSVADMMLGDLEHEELGWKAGT